MRIINPWRNVPPGAQAAQEEATLGKIDRSERIALFGKDSYVGLHGKWAARMEAGESLAEMKTNCPGGRLPRGEAAGQKCDLTNGV